MLIEVTVRDARDQAEVRHLLSCDFHSREFVDKIRGLLERALVQQAPFTVMLHTTTMPEPMEPMVGGIRWEEGTR